MSDALPQSLQLSEQLVTVVSWVSPSHHLSLRQFYVRLSHQEPEMTP